MIFKKFFNKDADKVKHFAQEFNLSEKVTELLLSRGLNTSEDIEEFINPKKLNDPYLLKGMKKLVDRVKLAKELRDKVLIFGDYDVDGWPSLVCIMFFLSGIQLFCTGISGAYLSKTYTEVKRRPIYIIKETNYK